MRGPDLPPGEPGTGLPPWPQPTAAPIWPAPPPPAPTSAPGYWVDPHSGLTLPEGTQLASHARRIGAYFLAVPLTVVTLGVGYIIWGLIVWGRGQTPTYQVLAMRCWRPETGRVAGWWWMALREIVGSLLESLLGIFTQALSFILFLATRERRTLHDMVAGTIVLHDPSKVLG
jgi:uncharacterized RDD family membrane protein YckC